MAGIAAVGFEAASRWLCRVGSGQLDGKRRDGATYAVVAFRLDDFAVVGRRIVVAPTGGAVASARSLVVIAIVLIIISVAGRLSGAGTGTVIVCGVGHAAGFLQLAKLASRKDRLGWTKGIVAFVFVGANDPITVLTLKLEVVIVVDVTTGLGGHVSGISGSSSVAGTRMCSSAMVSTLSLFRDVIVAVVPVFICHPVHSSSCQLDHSVHGEE